MNRQWKEWGVWIFPVFSGLCLLLTLFSVWMKPPIITKKPLEEPPRNLYQDAVAGIGVIEPASENITLGVEMSGVVRTIPVVLGQEVKKDAVLFSLDQRDIDATIAVLEASLIAAKLQAEMASTKFSLVEKIADKRAIALDDYNDRMYNKALALAHVDLIKAHLEQAKTTKERLSVFAPIDGSVLEIDVHVGEYATNGQVMMRFGDVRTMHVRVEIDEEFAKNISQTSKAYGLMRNDTVDKIPLTFVRIEPFVKAKQNLAVVGQRVDTRVMRIVYALPEGNKKFVGQQMDVYIEKNTQEDA